MTMAISKNVAERLLNQLRNSPIAPGRYAFFINAGTDHILDALDQNYFRGQLADGIGCFKYLEGGYGSGKTQFINSLAHLAAEQNVVTALVTVGIECPFNSPAAIFSAIMQSFQPPKDIDDEEEKGIDVLIDDWITKRISELGAEPGSDVPELVQRQIDEQIGALWKGAPDTQMAAALIALGKRTLSLNCGARESVVDNELTSWIRGDKVRSTALKEKGLFEPVRDDTAFRRLKTVIKFLRTRMGYRGFLVAFDEGTRTSSFRRGSTKQRQAVENMLTMINQNTEGEFGGVMFLYAATPDFRASEIQKYTALQDRIGTVAFSEGSPLVPLINIEKISSDDMIRGIGEKLLSVFEKAYEQNLNGKIQKANLDMILEAQKDTLVETPTPRYFVYQYCRFLDVQMKREKLVSGDEAENFVNDNEPPLRGDGA